MKKQAQLKSSSSKGTKAQPSNPTGKPPIIFDAERWKKINGFLHAQCDGATIARYFGVHPDTLYAKVVEKYGEEYSITTFSAYQDIKRGEGKELLRRAQFDAAMGGNSTMQIWLGKQYLSQKDMSNIEHGGSIKTTPFLQLMMEATAELTKSETPEIEEDITATEHMLNGCSTRVQQ